MHLKEFSSFYLLYSKTVLFSLNHAVPKDLAIIQIINFYIYAHDFNEFYSYFVTVVNLKLSCIMNMKILVMTI